MFSMKSLEEEAHLEEFVCSLGEFFWHMLQDQIEIYSLELEFKR